MSAIKDGGYIVELKGKEYRLLCSLNALDEIQTKFGGYDKLDTVFRSDNKNWIKDIKWLLTLLINEGLLEENENAELLNEQRVGRLVHTGNIKQIQQAVYASFVVGVKGDGEDEDIENNSESDLDEGETVAAQVS